MHNPLVGNFFAGPGSGKSTIAAGVFFELKSRGVNAENPGEYAKDCTWSKRWSTLEDQFYVFGKQHHRIHRLKDEVDVILMDSPILLNLAYALHYPECFHDSVAWAFNQYNNLNFVIKRVKPYNPKGRSQSEDESAAKHEQILGLLHKYEVPYIEVPGNSEGKDIVVSEIMKKLSLP